MSSLSFCFQGRTVRTAGTPDAPLFVARDVCEILEIANSRDAVSSLEEDEKGVATADTLGGPQQLQAVTLSGLFALVFKSRKPEARAFRCWVTGEVLPAIQRTGRYEVAPVPALPSHPEALRGWADALERESGLKVQLAAQAPAVALANRVVATGDDLTLRATAKLLNQEERSFLEMLHSIGFIYRLDGRWTPHAKFGERGQGLFRLRLNPGKSAGGAVFPQTIVTAKGLARIARELGITSFQQPLTLLPPASQAA